MISFKKVKKHCAQHNFEITLFNPRDEGEGVSGVAIDCHDASAGEPVSGFAQSDEQNLIKHITMYLDPLQQHILVGNPGSLSSFTSPVSIKNHDGRKGIPPFQVTRSPNHMFQVQRRRPGNTSRHLTRHPGMKLVEFHGRTWQGREVKTCFDWRSPIYVYKRMLWI